MANRFFAPCKKNPKKKKKKKKKRTEKVGHLFRSTELGPCLFACHPSPAIPSPPLPATFPLSLSLIMSDDMSQASQGNEDPAKAAMLDLDQDLVSKAALSKGRDAWTGMSWAERLAAVQEFETAQAAPPSRKASSANMHMTPKATTPKAPSKAPSSVGPTTPLQTNERKSSRISVPESRKSVSAFPPVTPQQPSIQPPSEAAASSHATPVNPPSHVSKMSSIKIEAASNRSRVNSVMSNLSAKASTTGRVSHTATPAAESFLAPPASFPMTPPIAELPQAIASAACTRCPGMKSQIARLEADLKTARKKQGKAANNREHVLEEENGALRGEVETLRAEVAGLREEAQEARSKAAQSDAYAAELKEQVAGFEDPELLYSQIWTLERALELRNEEIQHLRTVMDDFMVKIAVLDERLADALRKLLTKVKDDAEEKEKEVFGISSAEAVAMTKKKRKNAKGKRKSTQSITIDLDGIKNENDALKRKLTSLQLQSGHGGGDAASLRQIGEKDKLIGSLQEQLEKAQQAIISGVDKGLEMRREAEMKLKETRHVLKNLLGTKEAQQSVVVVQKCDLTHPQLTESDLIAPPDLPVWSHRPNDNTPVQPGPLSPKEIQAIVDTRLLRHVTVGSPTHNTCRSISPVRFSPRLS